MRGEDFAPDRVKAIRTRLGLSQQGLAERLGVSLNSVNRWERGHTKPLTVMVRQLLELEREADQGGDKAAA